MIAVCYRCMWLTFTSDAYSRNELIIQFYVSVNCKEACSGFVGNYKMLFQDAMCLEQLFSANNSSLFYKLLRNLTRYVFFFYYSLALSAAHLVRIVILQSLK